MSILNRRNAYWPIAGLVVLVVLVVLLPLHLGTHISGSADQQLYDQTVDLFEQQGIYAAAHAGTYAPNALSLSTENPRLTFAAPSNNSPVTVLTSDEDGHGYYVQLANESTGGAASFSMLVPRTGSPVLTCTGPGPLCNDGTFNLPASAFKGLAADQRKLYDNTLSVISEEHKYAASNGGQYQGSATNLSIADPRLSFIDHGPTPINLVTDSSAHGYYIILTGISSAGYATFSAIIPDSGKPTFTCVGAAPLCNRGTFKVPSSDYK